jgi:2-polyprenyl-6-methoxyphenol hydroxylase-like FAD-dependent oxidoreductase
MPSLDVLIAGAGPTGLALALWLARSGANIRIVDKVATPGTTSRALVVHARTLELYRQLGIADDVVARGVRFDAVNQWVKGRHAARVDVGAIGAGASPFPDMIIFPQDEHERLLIERLRECGVDVERPCELRGFDDRGDHIEARLVRDGVREETCRATWLAGCDGAHSTVREILGARFPGGTYGRVFYVADVTASGPVMNGELNVGLDEADLLAVFPMKGDGRARLIGTILPQREHGDRALEWRDVSSEAIERFRLRVSNVNWFSTYHVHHRVVSHFRQGRAFLLGDAAHIHSPVGGQGMNTGIGDALNLAWKLAGTQVKGTDARVLDTYEPERTAFADRLVETTDRGFQLVTSDGPLARFMRLQVVPRLFPPLFALPAMRRFMFRTLSQTSIRYRDSALSRGVAGRVHAGDRLPWIADARSAGARDGGDNYAPLTALDWQVHVYGEASASLVELCRPRRLALHAFAWNEATRAAGFARNGVYLVRPDGYVGFAADGGNEGELMRYLDAWRIAPRA